MIRIIVDDKIQMNPEQRYVIAVNNKIYDAETLRELVACICGEDYMENQSAETDWHMRRNAAKVIGMSRMMEEEMAAGKELPEDIIVYDERWGKIPYSLTDTDEPVDYEIHVENPTLIRIESDKTFLYTLAKGDFVVILEKDESGEHKDWLSTLDLDSLIEEELKKFPPDNKK